MKMETTLTFDCHFCHKSEDIKVQSEDYDKYEKGMHIQNAFPYLTPAQRELMISHTCDKCWDEMFAEEEDLDEGYDDFDVWDEGDKS